MLGKRAVWCVFKTGEAKDKADYFFVDERAKYKSAIMHNGNEHVQRDNIGLGAGPNITLKLLHEAHLFGRFDQVNLEVGHF